MAGVLRYLLPDIGRYNKLLCAILFYRCAKFQVIIMTGFHEVSALQKSLVFLRQLGPTFFFFFYWRTGKCKSNHTLTGADRSTDQIHIHDFYEILMWSHVRVTSPMARGEIVGTGWPIVTVELTNDSLTHDS